MEVGPTDQLAGPNRLTGSVAGPNHPGPIVHGPNRLEPHKCLVFNECRAFCKQDVVDHNKSKCWAHLLSRTRATSVCDARPCSRLNSIQRSISVPMLILDRFLVLSSSFFLAFFADSVVYSGSFGPGRLRGGMFLISMFRWRCSADQDWFRALGNPRKCTMHYGKSRLATGTSLSQRPVRDYKMAVDRTM